MIEVTTEDIVVDIVNDIDVSSTGNIDVVVEDNNELDITVAKKEFVIVGDDIYVPILYEDVPQWMKDLVSLSVNQAIEGVSTSNLDQLNSMLSEFATSYVPLNQYTQSILDLSNADVSLHAVIETLNSNYEDGITSANSQIITLQQTKASKDEVLTQVIETISAQLTDDTSDIGAIIARLDQAIVSSNQSSALSYQAITATLESMDGEISGNATAINTLSSYVGVVDGAVTGTGLLADVAILQKQNDGIIETTSGTYKVMLNPQDPNTAQLVTTAEPYASWKASETPGSIDNRLAHIGDVYIEYVSNANGMKEYVASYKFIRTAVDSTSPYATDSEGFTWALVVDQAAQDAYEQALNAFDLADDKRRVFVNTPYVPYDVGDLWLVQAGASIIGTTQGGRVIQAGDMLRCAETKTGTGLYEHNDWIPADNYRESMEAIKSNLQEQIDGKVDTYYQGTVPTGMTVLNNGDYWYCTTDISTYKKGKVYKYVHATTSWVETADVSRYAFDTADGKASIFTSTNVPTTGYKVNDMLIVIGSFNNGTATFSDGVVLSSTTTRTTGFTISDWVKKINDTEDLDDFVGNIYQPEINTLKAQVDAKIEYWFQTTDPKSAWTTDEERAKHNGDVWYNTTPGNNISQYYSSSTNSWNLISDKAALDAITAANAARQLADSKVEVRYGTAAQRDTTSNAWTDAEKTSNIGDLWIISDEGDDQNKQFRWTGTGWFDIRDKKIISNASAITALKSYVAMNGHTAGGSTSLLQDLNAEISAGTTKVDSKFKYDSTLSVDGINYNSGFGLATSLTSGSGLTTGQSEFWIKADKFKLMSADGSKKSSYSPFTVDATTGDITFNGKVSFNSINNAPSVSSNLLYNSEPSISGGTRGYVLGYNDTGITAVIGQNVGDWAPSGSSSIYIHSTGTPAPNTVFEINSEKKIPIVGGKPYCAYAYFGAHRCTAQLIIGFYDASGNIIQFINGPDAPAAGGGKSLSGYALSIIKVVAPSNAASVLMIYRGKNTTSVNPHVFVVRSYLGVIDSVNSETPEWSEGTSVTYTPSNVVSDINNGNTTTINGGRITTGSVTANQINTTGLIAENISANEIVGKTITGGSISGAIIEGSIIKASYLDLNGQLKVLTDYIISVAMYNANPSLYTDAVYISVYNNYRIPTLSVVKESNSVFTNIYSAGSIYNGSIFSYSTANAGTLLKAQKIRPPVTVLENTDIISSVSYKPWWYNINYHVCNHFRLSLNGITLIEVHVAYQSRAGGPDGNLEYSVTNISGNLISPINITRHIYSDSTYIPLVYNLDLGIKDVVLQHTCTTGGGAGYGWNYDFNTEIKITLNSGTRIMPFDWTSGNIKFEQLVDAHGSNSFTLKNIQITNLDL